MFANKAAKNKKCNCSAFALMGKADVACSCYPPQFYSQFTHHPLFYGSPCGKILEVRAAYCQYEPWAGLYSALYQQPLLENSLENIGQYSPVIPVEPHESSELTLAKKEAKREIKKMSEDSIPDNPFNLRA